MWWSSCGWFCSARRADRSRRARAVPAPSPCGGWTIVPSPNATDSKIELYAVAAVSTTDVWAVGSQHTRPGSGLDWPLEWHQLAGRCQPGGGWHLARYCRRLGQQHLGSGRRRYRSLDRPLGSRQLAGRGQPISGRGGFTGISAQSASDIWAVGAQAGGGTLDRTLGWHELGRSLAGTGVPYNTNHLNSVSVVSASDVWAVGRCCRSWWACRVLQR